MPSRPEFQTPVGAVWNAPNSKQLSPIKCDFEWSDDDYGDTDLSCWTRRQQPLPCSPSDYKHDDERAGELASTVTRETPETPVGGIVNSDDDDDLAVWMQPAVRTRTTAHHLEGDLFEEPPVVRSHTHTHTYTHIHAHMKHTSHTHSHSHTHTHTHTYTHDSTSVINYFLLSIVINHFVMCFMLLIDPLREWASMEYPGIWHRSTHRLSLDQRADP
jgi:hypothetical protein